MFPGYWNRPDVNASVFLERDGARWYNTGDVVRWVEDTEALQGGPSQRFWR